MKRVRLKQHKRQMSAASLANLTRAGQGRPRGAVSKHTRILKDCILLAAEAVGYDGAGKDGLFGYLRNIAENDPKTYAMLLARILPLQITGRFEQVPEVIETREQLEAELKRRNLPLPAPELIMTKDKDGTFH